jgi:hypothetical protein
LEEESNKLINYISKNWDFKEKKTPTYL